MPWAVRSEHRRRKVALCPGAGLVPQPPCRLVWERAQPGPFPCSSSSRVVGCCPALWEHSGCCLWVCSSPSCGPSTGDPPVS
uniref:Macaca fascicularis brain cDNA clone: QmoA-11839, similar to human BTG3 associated nuclear protein (BANP), transcriptvariant 2, mRNA, RefSeq: NM_079837.1 n=1 Tax=Macaca fascicularis TaxID=9541 RepID=I7GJ56_MACFA|nr:unnamed protein product [Macaca fascicularis]